jgi:hypothetical protein
MKYYAEIDVSLECSSICVVDAEGGIVREDKVLSEPDALVAWFAAFGAPMERIGLEAGPLCNGSMRGCRTPAWPSSSWRHGMCAPPSGPCR